MTMKKSSRFKLPEEKGSSLIEPGYIYVPYVPIMTEPQTTTSTTIVNRSAFEDIISYLEGDEKKESKEAKNIRLRKNKIMRMFKEFEEQDMIDKKKKEIFNVWNEALDLSALDLEIKSIPVDPSKERKLKIKF